MRKKLIVANWKMNGSLSSVRNLLAEIKVGIVNSIQAEIVVCAPYVFLPEVQTILQETTITWGGQDLSMHAFGAYTGEVSGVMLRDFGCRYVIIGHSERRNYHAESNELIAKKFAAALQMNLIPILCIGETLEQREKGITEDVISQQLDAVINYNNVTLLKQGVIAYEPVWAIGTGRTATPEQAQQVHAFVRNRIAMHDWDAAVKIQILYGGSMKPDNAEELMSKADIDGGLIGGASLKASDFLAICIASG